jgi:putative transposase
MARLARFCPVDIPQHIIQRGNNRQVCFNSKEDLTAYAYWLKEFSAKYRVEIHAWVFMTNHVHLLVTPRTEAAVAKLMQSLGRQYVQYFNKTYRRSGTLWEGRYKSCIVQTSEHLLQCYRYIELNPVRAGIVVNPSEYAWSSYRANAFGKISSLITPHNEYIQLGNTPEERQTHYRELFRFHLEPNEVDNIRKSVNKGLALGSDGFKEEVERNLKRRVTALKVGRVNWGQSKIKNENLSD